MRQLLIFFLRIYRYGVSPLLGPRCRFYPSCSCYAQTALELHGVWRGSWLAIRRLSRCHPWHPGGVDPVPEPRAREKGMKAEAASANCRRPGCSHGDHGDAETVQRDY